MADAFIQLPLAQLHFSLRNDPSPLYRSPLGGIVSVQFHRVFHPGEWLRAAPSTINVFFHISI
ncbi:hypothetical protein [Geopseudomonas aromaticivorans]